MGEVTEFLIYNATRRGGKTPEDDLVSMSYVAGVKDMRFHELMPDVLHWLGITRIDRFASMGEKQYDALIRQGITIAEQVPLVTG